MVLVTEPDFALLLAYTVLITLTFYYYSILSPPTGRRSNIV